MDVFLFGRLLDDALRAVVLGAGKSGGKAALLERQVVCGDVMALSGPVLSASGTGAVAGLLLDLDAEMLARIDLFAAVTGCCAQNVAVVCDGACIGARAYLPERAGAAEAGPWEFALWQARLGAASCLAVQEIMALGAHQPVATLRARFPMALKHAASQLRAGAEPAPASLRGEWGRDAIRPLRESRPYAWFFGVAEDDLQFRQFDGGWSPVVKRAGFLMCDAVTVLPYDPVRDVCLVIEQFRFGPYLRGARNCWSIEPVAGHIDPGECPEEAALREASEETRLRLSPEALLPVANVYPTPGPVSEFLFQFVALCDLPKSLEGVGGLASEAENIRSHILPFDTLLRLIETGEVQNGPLVLTAYWLALRRAELRAEAQPR